MATSTTVLNYFQTLIAGEVRRAKPDNLIRFESLENGILTVAIREAVDQEFKAFSVIAQALVPAAPEPAAVVVDQVPDSVAVDVPPSDAPSQPVVAEPVVESPVAAVPAAELDDDEKTDQDNDVVEDKPRRSRKKRS